MHWPLNRRGCESQELYNAKSLSFGCRGRDYAKSNRSLEPHQCGNVELASKQHNVLHRGENWFCSYLCFSLISVTSVDQPMVVDDDFAVSMAVIKTTAHGLKLL